MNLETLREYCIKKPAVTEGLPFGPDTLVFKVAGKMFLLISFTQNNRFNVKCDPELAAELRDQHPEIIPGYHMSKKMWNTVYMDGNLTDKQLKEMINHSYNEVVKTLPKKVREDLTPTLSKGEGGNSNE